MSDIAREIFDERARQIAKGYTPEHDDEHRVYDFARFINMRTWNIQKNGHEPRPLLIQIAALAVAAVESLDRAPRVHQEGGT